MIPERAGLGTNRCCLCHREREYEHLWHARDAIHGRKRGYVCDQCARWRASQDPSLPVARKLPAPHMPSSMWEAGDDSWPAGTKILPDDAA